MKVKLLYFSSIRDKVGKQGEEVEFEGSSVKELIGYLVEVYPVLKDSLDKVVFAVNEEYSDLDRVLKDGDVVAIIPPVSGG